MKIKGYDKYKPTFTLVYSHKNFEHKRHHKFYMSKPEHFFPLSNVPITAFYTTHFLSFFSSLFKDDNE